MPRYLPDGALASARRGRPPAAQLSRDERLDVAVEHRGDVADLDVGAVVLGELVGMQHVGADLGAEPDLHPPAAGGAELLEPALPLPLGKPGPQDLHGDRTVLELRALVLHG